MNKCCFAALLLILSTGFMLAQESFESKLDESDPVPRDSILEFTELVKIHKEYWTAAQDKGDRLLELYGLIYLFDDYTAVDAYVEAAPYINMAQELAITSKEPQWLAFVLHRQAALYSWIEDEERSIEHYKLSLRSSFAAKDSQLIAINFEQLGGMYGYINQFDSAHYYYELAFPLLKKFASKRDLAIGLCNYGDLLSKQNQHTESLSYFDEAHELNEELQDFYIDIIVKINAADALFELNRLDSARNIYHSILPILKDRSLLEDLMYSYEGLSRIYEKMDFHDSALIYYQEYEGLRDSLVGPQVQQDLAEKEVELVRKRLQNETSQWIWNSRVMVVIASLMSLLVIYLIIQWKRKRFDGLVPQENKQEEKQVTQSNTDVKNTEKMLGDIRENDIDNAKNIEIDELNLYKHHILTDDDWSKFKTSFSERYPGYILRLRNQFEDMTESEERLFILLKLRLKRNEIAEMLGILPTSVKRTRARLRKRLNLSTEKSLEQYILDF